MKTNGKSRLVITLAAMILIILSSLYGYRYYRDRLDTLNSEQSKLQAEVEILDLQIASTATTNAELAKISDIAEIIDDILPPTKVQSGAIAQIVSNGESNGITFTSISFPAGDGADFNLSQTEPLPEVPGVNTLKVQLQFNSTYPQMLALISEMETDQRISQIEEIRIAVSTDSAAKDDLSATINLNLYVKAKVQDD